MSEKEFLQHIRQHQKIITRLVGLYAHDTEERKDLYQEILYQAWKSWPRFRGESQVGTWLYRLCLNTIFTQKRDRNKVYATDSIEQISVQAPDLINHFENTERLYQAIRRLPEIDRAILSMQLDGYGNTEISQVIGISVNHVGVKLHRIKQQLSLLLKEEIV